MTPADHTPPTAAAAEPAPEAEPRFEHAYDGIEEFDNPMPRWWVLVFWATIAYSVVYVLDVVPLVGEGRGRIASYEEEMSAADRKYAASRAPRPAPADEVLLGLARDPQAREGGRALFMTNCMPCHRADAGGVIGPNLTDDYWIHGGRPGDIHRVVSAGILDKGMPAWSTVLAPADVDRVAAYVLSVHGTNPPNPKAPQGERATDDGDDAAEDD
jgi:cytochrome c oxidase cbb3-type subunit 3